MSAEAPPKDEMRYEALAQDALRGVVRAALKQAASPEGLPGAHHFYITFKTRAAGVAVPPDISEKYPDEMTVVIQHQYWDLVAGETMFSVMLRFGGQPKKLSIPYEAVTRFYDPSVQFLLQFETPLAIEEPEAEPEPAAPREDSEGQGGEDAPKVVSLDKFRKK